MDCSSAATTAAKIEFLGGATDAESRTNNGRTTAASLDTDAYSRTGADPDPLLAPPTEYAEATTISWSCSSSSATVQVVRLTYL